MRNKMQGCKKTYKIHIKNPSTTHIYISIVVILVGHEIKKIFDFRFSIFEFSMKIPYRFSIFVFRQIRIRFDFRFSIFESVYLDFRPTL